MPNKSLAIVFADLAAAATLFGGVIAAEPGDAQALSGLAQCYIAAGELVIDPDRRRVTVRGEEVDLTHLEFELLVTMAYAPGRVFTRDMLLERAWGGSAYRERRTVDVHVLHLREKIERDPRDPEYVITVRGLGYRFRDSDDE